MLKKLGPIAKSVLKLQILIFAILVICLSYPFIGKINFFAITAALSAIYLFILFFETRKRVGNFREYAIFFAGVLGFAIAAVSLPAIQMPAMLRFQISIGVIIAALVFVLAFRFLFGKKYAIGKVIMYQNEKALVELDFDLASFTSARQILIDSNKSVPAGKKVKIGIKNSVFGAKYGPILDN